MDDYDELPLPSSGCRLLRPSYCKKEEHFYTSSVTYRNNSNEVQLIDSSEEEWYLLLNAGVQMISKISSVGLWLRVELSSQAWYKFSTFSERIGPFHTFCLMRY